MPCHVGLGSKTSSALLTDVLESWQTRPRPASSFPQPTEMLMLLRGWQAIVWCNQLVVLLARMLRSLPDAAGPRPAVPSRAAVDEEDRLRLTTSHLRRHLRGRELRASAMTR